MKSEKNGSTLRRPASPWVELKALKNQAFAIVFTNKELTA
jgi:hypothetical protein